MAYGPQGEQEPRPTRYLWVWRGFFVLFLVAAAFVVALAEHGSTGAATAWAVVGLVWLAAGLSLRRMHSDMDLQEYRRLMRDDPGPDRREGSG